MKMDGGFLLLLTIPLASAYLQFLAVYSKTKKEKNEEAKMPSTL